MNSNTANHPAEIPKLSIKRQHSFALADQQNKRAAVTHYVDVISSPDHGVSAQSAFETGSVALPASPRVDTVVQNSRRICSDNKASESPQEDLMDPLSQGEVEPPQTTRQPAQTDLEMASLTQNNNTFQSAVASVAQMATESNFPQQSPQAESAQGPVGSQMVAETSTEQQKPSGALMLKLQETYKTIVRLELELQKHCAALISVASAEPDVPRLWEVYKINAQLIDAYVEFLVTALCSEGTAGKGIVDIYRIERRFWVYGTVTFLDVLKNYIANYLEPEVCNCFISHVFESIAQLSDLPHNLGTAWYERLGDLSRMAIALYPSHYIDWKSPSEYWYKRAMSCSYGHGKLYYHIATVQQDGLDAMCNLAKSVFCRDCFVPSAQYMRLVIDNISQRSKMYDHQLLEFIKVHKLILADSIGCEVGEYCARFGTDIHLQNFFVRDRTTTIEHIHFWFSRGSSFALVNILQLCGFGNAENPFALLFDLPACLRARNEKKEKKRKNQIVEVEHTVPQSIDEWTISMRNLDFNAVQLGISVLSKYLDGPFIASTSHIITWFYFVLAVGLRLEKVPEARPVFNDLLARMFPWSRVVEYLNFVTTRYLKNDATMRQQLVQFENQDFLAYYGSNETLPEVWKCWGTLWFDNIANKGDYQNPSQAGIDEACLEIPTGGDLYNKDKDSVRFLRIVLLAKRIASLGIGLTVTGNEFINFSVAQKPSNNIPGLDQILDRLGSIAVSTPIPVAAPLEPLLNDDGYSGCRESESSIEENPEAAAVASDCPDLITHGDLGQYMDTSLTYVFLDTNMWLRHFGRLYKMVSSNVFKLAVTLTTYQELRYLKRTNEASIVDAATRAIITIRQLYADGRVLPVRFNGNIATNLDEHLEFEEKISPKSPVDAYVLNAVMVSSTKAKKAHNGLGCTISGSTRGLNQQEASLFHYSILITEDKHLRTRAKAIDVAAFPGKWLFSTLDRIAGDRCAD